MATLRTQQYQPSARPHHQLLPEERRTQLLTDLSLNLQAFISQRLIPVKADGVVVAAVEVLLNSPIIADLIQKAKSTTSKKWWKNQPAWAWSLFDQALYEFVWKRRYQL